MSRNYILYQEKVEMPSKEIGIKAFHYDCRNAPTTGVFGLHWHHCIELIAVHTGWMEIEVDRQTFRIEAGDLCVINPSQLHACTVFNRETTLTCLIIDMDVFRSRYVDSLEERYIAPLVESRIALPCHVASHGELLQLVRSCCDAFLAQESGYQLHLKGLLFSILHLLYTQSGEVTRIESKQNPASLSRERVNTILQYVDTHYAERIKLDDLVQILHINKYYICKIFQQYIGKTFLDYVNLVRIQKAVELIVNTNDSITAIAFATGFQDINYFSRMFKRVMGISPTELRKRHRNNSRN